MLKKIRGLTYNSLGIRVGEGRVVCPFERNQQKGKDFKQMIDRE